MIFVALLASLGVNLISSILLANSSTLNSAILGLLIVVSSLVMFVFMKIRKRKHELEVKSFFLVKKDGSLASGGGYYFAEQFHRVASAVFHENPRFHDQWTKGISAKWDGRDGSEGGGASRLAKELAEYVAIRSLSSHLTSHFNDSGIPGSKVRKFTREDLSEVVLKNRVLELISRDMEDREGFEETLNGPYASKVSSVSSVNRIYYRLDLTLPRNSKIMREKNGDLAIKTPHAKIFISTRFSWISTYVSEVFLDRVLGTSFFDSRSFLVKFKIRTEVNVPHLLFTRNEEYFSWINSYLGKFSRDFDKEEYFETIKWDSLEVLLLAKGLDKGSPKDSVAE